MAKSIRKTKLKDVKKFSGVAVPEKIPSDYGLCEFKKVSKKMKRG